MGSAPAEKLTIVAKDNADTLAKSGSAAINGLGTLTSAYQDMARRNVEKLVSSFHRLSSVKTPAEFFEVQQSLLTEGYESAVADGKVIAELTSSVFSASVGPIQKRFAAQ